MVAIVASHSLVPRSYGHCRRFLVPSLQAAKFDAAQVIKQQRLLEESDFSSKQSKALVELVSFAVGPLATSEAVAAVEKKVDSTDKLVKWTLGLSAVALVLQFVAILAPPQALATPPFNFLLSLLPK